jgi:E3 ubiquitin-protein ligase MARCH6
MEINVALDELLGLRGPLTALLRNLLWLLVFNTVYLGFFTFVPRTIGAAVFSTLLNTTTFENALEIIPILRAENATNISLKASITLMNEQSKNLNTIFRLTDFAAVNLGYFFCAAVVVVMRYSWLLMLRFRREPHGDDMTEVAPPAEVETVVQDDDGGDDQEGPRANPVADHDDQHHLVDRLEHPWIALGEAVSLILDATVAVVKVGVLLFLKMFLLPVLLGIWLDASSMDLFGCNAEERLAYAGSDVFSFILLHWVAGITFMLLVTVSVLQLREVAHSDLLAHLIRPQEPQPDLLGNLLHDSVLSQSKRMLLSLGTQPRTK